jgi:hypothetical protein
MSYSPVYKGAPLNASHWKFEHKLTETLMNKQGRGITIKLTTDAFFLVI